MTREQEALLGADGGPLAAAHLAVAPNEDDSELGADDARNNAFLYGDDLRGRGSGAAMRAGRIRRDAL
jgi:hypothetical protein